MSTTKNDKRADVSCYCIVNVIGQWANSLNMELTLWKILLLGQSPQISCNKSCPLDLMAFLFFENGNDLIK